jgi:predicted permease
MLSGSIKWIMMVSGVLTCTMVYAVIAPQAMLQSTFGETLEGPLTLLIVRNWGALIFLVGAMLIYGAFTPAVRPLVLSVAAASKVVFIALVVSHGSRYTSGQAGISIAVDSVMVLVFGAYLAFHNKESA